MRARTVTRYEVDGLPVTTTTVNDEYPRFYAVRIGDGPVVGYLRRSALGHGVDAYLGSAEPDTMGAEPLGSYESMRLAVEPVVREALSRDASVFEQARAKAEAAGLQDELALARATRIRAQQVANACARGVITLGERNAETRALRGQYYVAMRRLGATRREAWL